MEEANKDYEAFLSALGLRESSGRYDVENPWGYLGKYQMGEAALIDAGYYLQDGTAKNDWKGKWTGKDGVWSKEDYLSSPGRKRTPYAFLWQNSGAISTRSVSMPMSGRASRAFKSPHPDSWQAHTFWAWETSGLSSLESLAVSKMP